MGVLYGIAAALPVFRRQCFGHFVNIASTAAHLVVQSVAVYACTKASVRVISDGLQEAVNQYAVNLVTGFDCWRLTETEIFPGAATCGKA